MIGDTLEICVLSEIYMGLQDWYGYEAVKKNPSKEICFWQTEL